jgi:tetratricopeptide (TPR) repeat protein
LRAIEEIRHSYARKAGIRCYNIRPAAVQRVERQNEYVVVIGITGRIGKDDLSQRDRYPWQRGSSLEMVIFVDWYDHPAEHWADVYLSRGEIDRAIALREAVATTVHELMPHDPKRYSYVVYKLGALYARHGRSDRAIGAIREALSVNPSLVEWVRKDTDLDSLRPLPAFQAIDVT